MNLSEFSILAFEGGAPWWNYPGLELWKFVNLAIFIIAGLILHRVFGRPISEALRSRRESIKVELIRAREERDQALKQLEEVESRLSGLTNEVDAIREKAKVEAEVERRRIQEMTEQELAKMKESARREIESAGKVAVNELRMFASKQSIRLAEDLIRTEMRPEDEERLIRHRVGELGGTPN